MHYLRYPQTSGVICKTISRKIQLETGENISVHLTILDNGSVSVNAIAPSVSEKSTINVDLYLLHPRLLREVEHLLIKRNYTNSLKS